MHRAIVLAAFLSIPAASFAQQPPAASAPDPVNAATAPPPAAVAAAPDTGLTMSYEEMQALPLSRNALDALLLAPGATPAFAGASVRGSSAAENAFYANGVHANTSLYGFPAVSMPIEFTSDVSVATTSLPVEYSHTTGGVVAVTTRKGGQRFLGGAFADDSAPSLQSTNAHLGDYAQLVAATDLSSPRTAMHHDFGMTLSGPIATDRASLFAAYERSVDTNELQVVRGMTSFLTTAPRPGSRFDRTLQSNIYALRADVRVNERLVLTANVFGDPGRVSGPLQTIAGEPGTFLASQSNGSNNGSAAALWMVRGWRISGEMAEHRERSLLTPVNDSVRIIDQTQAVTTSSGGYGFFADERGVRDAFRASASTLFHFAGDHLLRFGGESEHVTDDETVGYTGSVAVVRFRRGGNVLYRKRFYAVPGSPASNLQIEPSFRTEPHDDSRSLWLADTWSTRSVAADVGVRWERQGVYGDPAAVYPVAIPPALSGTRLGSFTVRNEIAPRVSLAWSPAAQTRLVASAGRYFEQIPLDLNVRLFGGETFASIANPDPDPLDVRPAGTGSPSVSENLGAFIEPSVRGQHVDEVVIGLEHRLSPSMTAGIHAIGRRVGSVIEDFACDLDTDFCFGNVGPRGVSIDPATFDTSFVPVPRPRRDYRALQLTASQHSGRIRWMASYVFSKLKGNYEGLIEPTTGEIDPNVTAQFDLANLYANRSGYLDEDRRHQVKLFGSADLSWLTLGGVFTFASGSPLTTLGSDPFYGVSQAFLTHPAEAVGRSRTPSLARLDLHAGVPLPVSAARVSIVVDVFNALNRQAATAFDQRWDFTAGQNASFHPGVTAAAAPNPDYMRPTSWQSPREIRFAVRADF